MKVTVWKNDKESNERVITRFTKMVQKSRKVMDIRRSRYHSKSLTKGQVRAGAIMRDFYRKKREKSRFY